MCFIHTHACTFLMQLRCAFSLYCKILWSQNFGWGNIHVCFTFPLMCDCPDLYSVLIKDARGVGKETLTHKAGRNILKFYKILFFFFLSTMKSHHEAENSFLNFIWKVHKVTMLEQVIAFFFFFLTKFVLTKFKICTIGYLSQKH